MSKEKIKFYSKHGEDYCGEWEVGVSISLYEKRISLSIGFFNRSFFGVSNPQSRRCYYGRFLRRVFTHQQANLVLYVALFLGAGFIFLAFRDGYIERDRELLACWLIILNTVIFFSDSFFFVFGSIFAMLFGYFLGMFWGGLIACVIVFLPTIIGVILFAKNFNPKNFTFKDRNTAILSVVVFLLASYFFS
ncbi:hypothetical protein EXS61_00935 [Candidatus Parcubacteria bacterium]|nr:hypothetical protein [Candidatus Parcubacteria bacterium]